MDLLYDHAEEVEEHIFFKTADLSNLKMEAYRQPLRQRAALDWLTYFHALFYIRCWVWGIIF